ncbi:MAG TPA: hypothetical protein VHE35_08235 [Kofleriaceae bacterium]|nr:hypothetical protein [Kofleriaceae bacterium]
MRNLHLWSMSSAALALALAVGACGDPDPAPTVEIRAAAPSMLVPSDDTRDDLMITVGYTDADADLGMGSAAVVDCRADGLVTTLPIPAIASQEAIDEGVPIRGELVLNVNDVGAIAPATTAPAACAELGVGPPAIGVAIFCVTLTDAAGHTGPGACTDPIAIAP